MDQEQFRRLFKLYVSGKCSPEERDAFFDWYQQHQDEEGMKTLLDELYDEVKLNTNSPAFISADGKLDIPGEGFNKTKVVPIARKQLRRWYYAAAVVLVAGIASWLIAGSGSQVNELAFHYRDTNKVEVIAAYTTVRTGNNERKVIVLSDSTRIVLNGGTELRYPDHFEDNLREVYLEGEAYFEVSKAAQWPFVIESPGKVKTTVLGTSFNIKAYPGRQQATVSVVTGKVKVSQDNKVLSTLVKGQELQLEVITGIAKKRIAIPANILAWQSGNISFTDESLKDILMDLQIYYGTKIELQNDTLSNVVMTIGFFKNTSIESALDNLCELANAKYARNNGGYIVY
ncbi:FecR family protein [Chitinophaga caeni]|uniref:FecR family protein n=1 Tax=Chitinophaga caeni TaxID=2029983 RepID=UPI0012FE3BB2|nr:FecR domain-containing protein [Chitinophaga caeni]